MEKYLYLTRTIWVRSWVQGGPIPLNLASAYKSAERKGIYTIDENLIHESNYDLNKLSEYGMVCDSVRNLSIGSFEYNGVVVARNIQGSKYEDDGLILSLCNVMNRDIARKMGKLACVKINDVNKLKLIIDEQLGVAGIARTCTYTESHIRNHFTKSLLDKWQNEYRIFWKVDSKKEIMLPKGIAKRINL